MIIQAIIKQVENSAGIPNSIWIFKPQKGRLPQKVKLKLPRKKKKQFKKNSQIWIRLIKK